jgi:hypothetical protein
VFPDANAWARGAFAATATSAAWWWVYRIAGVPASVFVVVFAVRGVPAPVVHVVDMVSVRHGHMTTPVTVDVVMIFVHGVAGRFAFVVVTVVQSMKVTVVHVVDMVPMRDRHMAASSAVDVVMINMLAVSCGGHRFSPPFRVISTRKSLAGRNFNPDLPC